MPTKEAHLAAADRNSVTIRHLIAGGKQHAAWITTVAFYRALHLVEAVFALDGIHMEDHGERHDVLRTTKRYQHIWMSYRPLFQASMIARYLQGDDKAKNYDIFEDYMGPDKVDKIILAHHLKQIEQSADRLLNGS